MAKNRYEDLAADTWTLISESGVAVSAAMIMNPSGNDILLAGTATEVAPTNEDGAFPLLQGRAVSAGTTFAEIFPGVGTSGYFYAKSKNQPHRVFISHA